MVLPIYYRMVNNIFYYTMRQYRFYKDEELGWFIEIPNFPFNKAWLAMVAGADLLLDKLSEGNNEITLKISAKHFPTCTNLIEREHKLGLFRGATYTGGTSSLIPTSEIGRNRLWLCPATLWVFWRYPKKIYFEVIS